MKRIAVILCICFSTFFLHAQKEMDLAAHKTIGYLGAGLSRPVFVGKDYEPIDLWQSVHLKQGLFFMDFRWGRHIMKQADSTAFIGKGFIFNWGMRFSKPTTNKKGRLTIGSFAFSPKFDFGIGFASIPLDSVTKGFGDGPMSFGVHMSPGVIVRASSMYIIASCDIDAMMSVQPFGKERKTFNLGRGLIVSPSVTLAFDNGWELLSPKIRHREGTYTYTEYHTTGISYRTTYNSTTDQYESWRIERGYSVEKLGFYSYTIHKVDPFIGLGPVYSFYTHNNYGSTQMIGAVAGMKLSFLKLDAQYLVGQKGMGNGISDDIAQSAQYNGRTLNFTSAVPATEMSASAGVNLANILFGRKNEVFYDGYSKWAGSTFYGICIYYRYGRMTFNSAPTYTFAGAEQALDSLFATNLHESSATTDARKIPSKSIMQGVGVSLDFGMVSLSAEKLRYKSAPIANGWNVKLALVIPVRKAIHLSKLTRRVRKGNVKSE